MPKKMMEKFPTRLRGERGDRTNELSKEGNEGKDVCKCGLENRYKSWNIIEFLIISCHSIH